MHRERRLMDEVRKIIKDKVIYLKNSKGITYSWMAKQSGLKRWDVAHFATGTRIRQDKFNKLKNFIINY